MARNIEISIQALIDIARAANNLEAILRELFDARKLDFDIDACEEDYLINALTELVDALDPYRMAFCKDPNCNCKVKIA